MATPTSRGPDCLDDATIVAFLEGELWGAARETVDAHVDRCSVCLSLVAAVGRVDGEPALPEGPDRYEIRDEVGIGGMGQVFEAYDTVLRREVALKCVRSGPEDRAAARRFEREMELTAQLQHPSIIAVYDAGLFPDGSRYFAMRLVQGRSLEDAIAEATSFEDRIALVPSIRRACEAVAYAHEQGVIHRDLKPANVLIGPFGETVVLDWGLAKHVGDEDPAGESLQGEIDEGGMTRPGAVMGTPGYIAPEVARGEGAGLRSDVFSLGQILAKLLADAGGSREVRSDLQAIVDRATASEPEERYADASALCDDLRRFEAGQTVAARDYSLRSRVRRFVRRSRVSAGVALPLGVLGLVGLAAIGGVATWRLGLHRSREACLDRSAQLTAWWDEQARASVERALTSGDPRSVAWSDVSPILDDYARDLAGARQTSCIAAEVDDTLPATQWEATRACLDDRERLLRATVDVWLADDLDDEVRSRAVETASQLPPIEACEEASTVMARYGGAAAVPAGETATEVLQLLARASALDAAGRFTASLERADEAEQKATGLEHPGLRAQVAFRRGTAIMRLDRPEAVSTFERALALAQAAGLDWLISDTLMMLVAEEAHRGAYERADVWARMAQMRVDPVQDPEKFFVLRGTQGDLLAMSGKPAEAEALLRSTLTDYAPSGLSRARLLNALAGALRDRDRLEEAKRALEEALPIYAEVWGPTNPRYGQLLASLASVVGDLGDLDRAHTLLETARGILEVSHGPRSYPVSVVLNNLAQISRDSGEAIALYTEALAITREALGDEHPEVAEALLNLGVEALDAGDLELAERSLRDAKTLGARVHPKDSQNQGHILYNLGSLEFYRGNVNAAVALYREALPYFDDAPLWRSEVEGNLGVILGRDERWEEATPHLEHALEIRLGMLPPGHDKVVLSRSSLAEARLAAGETEAARTLAAQAIADGEAADLPPDYLVEARFVLARVLWPRDPAEAVEVARRARADVDPGRKTAQDRLDAWLAAH